MRSEFQFLMSADDERHFISAFVQQADALKKESESQWWFQVGDCRIQFLPSRRAPDQIALGRIALATRPSGEDFPSGPRAEKLFKAMRAWLKKRYSNRLTAENITIPESTTSYRMMWLGPDARVKSRSGAVTLKSLFSGPVVIKEEPNQSLQPAAPSGRG